MVKYDIPILFYFFTDDHPPLVNPTVIMPIYGWSSGSPAGRSLLKYCFCSIKLNFSLIS